MSLPPSSFPAHPTTTHGSDKRVGPPCCWTDERNANCPGKPCRRSCCCCDPCRHLKIGPVPPALLGMPGSGGDVCRDGDCCKCVPKFLEVRFALEAEADEVCQPQGAMLLPEIPGDGTTVYAATVAWLGEVRITLTPHWPDPYGETPYAVTRRCHWRVEVPDLDIDERHELDHTYVTCTEPPAIEFPLTLSGPCGELCPGVVTIGPHAETKLPFVSRPRTDPWAAAVTCGGCSEVCTRLCVRRGSDPYRRETVEDRHEFVWDESTETWRGGKQLTPDPYCDDACEVLSLVEIDGSCYLQITALEVETLVGDLIAIDPYQCFEYLNLYAEDALGNWIRITCGRCHCWEYTCGKCRCICSEMCLIGMDGDTQIGPLTLPWDEETSSWTDESGEQVRLVGSGDCCTEAGCGIQINDFDPVAIDRSCGSLISASVSTDLESIFDGYEQYRWRSVWCRFGVPCHQGDCLSGCPEIPGIIMADLEALPFDATSPCLPAEPGPYDDPPPPCFAPFSLPLILLRSHDPDTPPAAQWRWRGQVLFACTGCSGGVFVERLWLLSLDWGCDGQLRIILQRPGESHETTRSAPAPCSTCEPVEEVVEFAFDATVLCCNAAGFKLTLTEGT